jgi:hypothetical protein
MSNSAKQPSALTASLINFFTRIRGSGGGYANLARIAAQLQQALPDVDLEARQGAENPAAELQRELVASLKSGQVPAFVRLETVPGVEARVYPQTRRVQLRAVQDAAARFPRAKINERAGRLLLQGMELRAARESVLTFAEIKDKADTFAWYLGLQPNLDGRWNGGVDFELVEKLLQAERADRVALGASRAEVDTWEAQMVAALNDM